MSLTVSIVSFNTKDLLEELLNVLVKLKFEEDFKIVVVDNNSGDGSLEMVEKNFGDKVRVFKNNSNLGFAKAQNRVLKNVDSDFYLVLNPDTSLEGNVIKELLNFMRGNPKCGVLSCKILGFDGKLQSNGGDFPVGTSLFNWLFNLESVFGGKSFHRTDNKYFEKSHEVDWVGGTIMLIRKEVLEKINGFNEDYFMYFEDVEFCYKVRKVGYEVWIDPEVSIRHKSGASSQNPRYRQWAGEFSGIIYFYRNSLYKGFAGIIGSLVVRILIYKAIFLRMLAFGLIGKFSYTKTYAKVFINI